MQQKQSQKNSRSASTSAKTGGKGGARVRLMAAEPVGGSAEPQKQKNSRDNDSRRKGSFDQKPSKEQGRKQDRDQKHGGNPEKEQTPPSLRPIHQILPYLYLVIGIFLGVTVILNINAASGNSSEHPMGPIGYWLCRVLFGVLGYGAFALPAVFISLAVFWRRAVDNGTLAIRLTLTFLTTVVLSAYLHILLVSNRGDAIYQIGWLFSRGAELGGGGVVGGVIGQALFDGLRLVGSSILCIATLILLVMFLVGVTPVYVWTKLRYRIHRNLRKRASVREAQDFEDSASGRKQKGGKSRSVAEEDEEPELEEGEPNPREGVRKDRRGREETETENESSASAVPSGNGKNPVSGKRARKSRFGMPEGDEDVLPVMTDESLPRTEKEKAESDKNLVHEKLNMDAVYETPRMQYERGRVMQSETLSDKVREANGVRSGAAWMQEPADTDETAKAAEAAEAKQTDTASEAAKPDPDAKSTKSGESSDNRGEDERIRDMLGGVTVTQAQSEAEQYLPQEEDVDQESVIPDVPAKRPYSCPPVDLMSVGDRSASVSEVEIERSMQTLKMTLESFHITIREMNYACGPTITRYEIRPEAGIRVRQVANLVDDIALGLAKSGVRIEAPIPGKPAIGIEVPNDNPETVFLRKMIDCPEFLANKGKLSVCLGEDISGKQVYFDLVKMPHLLVAGATGMGKSVCINCLITSLLYRFSPEDVRLILVDPKQVEFVPYKDIPHLLVPIITEPKTAAGALLAAVDEMEDRFTKIKELGVRDIRGYNEIAAMDADVQKLPYLVIIIDELADLMLTAPDDVENSICRLAAKARAAGIHLVLGTQRPSVDVIKGTIKSNIPSRIAFTVASQVDSKTILDNAGAEKLIGRGDMLYAPVGAMKPIRVQGAFVSDKEVERITDFVKQNNDAVQYDEQFMKRMMEAAARSGAKKNEGLETDGEGAGRAIGEDTDKMQAALEVIFDTGRASTSLLQRKLSIGYGRAAKILDELQELGIIGPQDGSKPRAILVNRQDYMEYYNQNGCFPGFGGSGGGNAENLTDSGDLD